MIAATMLYLTLFGALIAGAAWSAERVCVRLGIARRWTWLAAMLLMCAMPLVPAEITSRLHPPIGVMDVRAASSTAQLDRDIASVAPAMTSNEQPGLLPVGVVHALASVIGGAAGVMRPLDVPLAIAWGLASATLLGITFAGARRIARLRASWRVWNRETFLAPATWLSEDVGPAAFGAARGEIVVPRWAMALPTLDRRLLLMHERSHVEARDPMLLSLGTLMVIVMPWNAPLRWAHRRLQRAIEHDCDRRVLMGPTMARRYADLLLHVAERGIAMPTWPQRATGAGSFGGSFTSLMSGEPDLESRLRALVRPAVTWRTNVRAIGAAGAALLLTLMACTVPMPRRAEPLLPAHTPRNLALGRATRDPDWVMRTKDPAAKEPTRNLGDSLYAAHADSLVIDAIERSRPTLLNLAATETPYVAIALTPSNEVISHSIRAGAPVRRDTSPESAMIAQFERAAAQAGVGSIAYHDADFRGRMQVLANSPFSYLDSLGISHLQVGDHPLTVLWVRFRDRTGV